jgi:hypothetical protein
MISPASVWLLFNAANLTSAAILEQVPWAEVLAVVFSNNITVLNFGNALSA